MSRVSLMLLVILGLLLLVVAGARSGSHATPDSLRAVIVLHRHGARTPYGSVPDPAQRVAWNCTLATLDRADLSPPNANHVDVPQVWRKSYLAGRQVLAGNCPQGQLLRKGHDQLAAVGQSLRARYGDFLGSAFAPATMFVRSTDYDRTFHSAEALLSTLFPAGPAAAAAAADVPVSDIHTVQQETDTLYPRSASACPALGPVCSAMEQTTAWAQNKAKLDALSQTYKTLWNVTELPAWFELRNLFECRQASGVGLPAGVTEAQVAQIGNVTSWQLGYLYANPSVQRLAIGQFMGELAEAMGDIVAGRSSLRYLHYSAHDVTVGLVTSALGVWPGVWPAFASHLVMELHQDAATGAWSVAANYEGNTVRFSTCPSQDLCAWDAWLAHVRNIVPSDWSKECTLPAYVPRAVLRDDIVKFLC